MEFLEDPEILVWILHPDRAFEVQIRELLHDLMLGLHAASKIHRINGKAEWDFAIGTPEVLRPPADIGMEFLIGGALAPELEDVACENAP